MSTTSLGSTADKTIPGIDGYVIEVESDRQISLGGDGGSPYVVPDDYVLVTMNDSEGREFYLIAPADLNVTTQ